MIRVLIADDHPLIREGLASVVASMDEATVVAETGRGDQAVELVERTRPDVAVIDLSMPGMHGLDVIAEIRLRVPEVRVLVLSVSDDPKLVSAALEAGASGFILKGSSPARIRRTIEAVADETLVIDASISVSPMGQVVSEPRVLASLTSREREVLDALAAGMSNREIAAELYLGEKTVRNHVSRLFAKLGASTRSQAIVMARGAGLGRRHEGR